MRKSFPQKKNRHSIQILIYLRNTLHYLPILLERETYVFNLSFRSCEMKPRMKRSRISDKALRVDEGRVRKRGARGGNLRVGGKARALPVIFTP